MSEKKRIGGGGSQSGEPTKPLKAEGSTKKGVQQRSQKTAASKKRPQQKPTHPPVTVRRIHGDTKGKNYLLHFLLIFMEIITLSPGLFRQRLPEIA